MEELLSSKKPKICLSLTERTVGGDLQLAERERERIDLVELRSDFLSPEELPHAAAVPRKLGLPSILVFRRRSDGGARPVAESDRQAILARALEGEWTYVELEDDIEGSALEKRAAEHGTQIIRSFHDLEGVPEGLAARVEAMPRTAREMPMVAVTPRSTADLLRVLRIADQLKKERLILTGMGEWGFPTRVLPGRFSSALTYSSAGGVLAASGRVTPEVLRSVYRLGELGAGAAVYCVIGNPVLHSRSPWIHNPALRALGLDALYVPIPVDDIEAFADLAEALPIAGASVTVPHKVTVQNLLARKDASVDDAGACNTLVREGRDWHGYNTDIEGFLAPLRDLIGGALKGSSALVVGAGGAARAVVAGLTRAGCRVMIVNRSGERAAALARQFGCEWEETSSSAVAGGYDIVVQATSAGMTPNEDVDPLPGYQFRGNEIFYELIYAPARTRLLERAARSGCRLIGGREMLLRQAHAQFRLFTGHDYPAEGVEIQF